jgi:hypothetical protein
MKLLSSFLLILVLIGTANAQIEIAHDPNNLPQRNIYFLVDTTQASQELRRNIEQPWLDRVTKNLEKQGKNLKDLKGYDGIMKQIEALEGNRRLFHKRFKVHFVDSNRSPFTNCPAYRIGGDSWTEIDPRVYDIITYQKFLHWIHQEYWFDLEVDFWRNTESAKRISWWQIEYARRWLFMEEFTAKDNKYYYGESEDGVFDNDGNFHTLESVGYKPLPDPIPTPKPLLPDSPIKIKKPKPDKNES